MKYNKSEIMSKAWSLVRRFPNKYNMSSALKKAWARAKVRMAEAMEELKAEKAAADRAARISADPICSKLVAAGGKLWENYGKRRIYLSSNSIVAICNGLSDLYSNIVDSERVSNTTRRQYFEAMDGGIYYDLDACKWNCPHTYRYTENIISRLTEAVA